MRQSRKDKLDRIFKDRRWGLEREVHLPEGQVFQTPLGTKGRHGFLIFDRDAPDTKYVVGARLLRLIHEEYDSTLPISNS